MKFLIAVFCVLAVVSAGYITPIHQKDVIGAHGVPLESAENVAARNFHHSAHAEATSFHQNAVAHAAPWADETYENDNNAWVSPITAHTAHAEAVRPWSGPQHMPVIGHNGVPVDTHENNARRNFHHAAYAEAISRHGGHSAHYDNAERYAVHATPVVHSEPIHQWTGPQHLPVIGHNGVPVDTHENNARRDFHHAAYAQAVSRNGAYTNDHNGVQGYATQSYGAHAAPATYGVHTETVHQWTGPQHIPVIGHNGVPVDTHENSARRAFHHAAHAEASAQNHHDDSWKN